MTPKQMQDRSAEKVKQVMELAKVLHLQLDVRQRVNKNTGFIELIPYWIDNENYPAEAPKAEEAAAPEAPAGPTAEAQEEKKEDVVAA